MIKITDEYNASLQLCDFYWAGGAMLRIVSANRMTYNSILNSLKGHWELALRILEAWPRCRCQLSRYPLSRKFEHLSKIMGP